MDDFLPVEVSENGKPFGERKYNPNAIKKKLSLMNKKIADLHKKRKFAYKNSVKVKKMVHNQVNQIIRCLRTRERDLWSVVDEFYISQDTTISDELSKLQSVHARCKVLFNHIDDFKGNRRNILSRIHSLLAEINFEMSDTKSLEFKSEFEAMKTRASNYGCLEGDLLKKDDISDKKDSCLSNAVSTQILEKIECCDQVSNMEFLMSDNDLDDLSTTKEEPEVEDTFQIIDLLDNMCCHDDSEDYIMCEEDAQICGLKTEKEFNAAYPGQNKLTKVCENSKYSCEITKSFNPEEEWRHVLEMNKKIADFKDLLKSQEEKSNCNVYNDGREQWKSKDSLNNCKEKSILLKERDNWLSSTKEKKFENINVEKNLTSPAELIQKAFKPYFTGKNIKNWLSCE